MYLGVMAQGILCSLSKWLCVDEVGRLSGPLGEDKNLI